MTVIVQARRTGDGIEVEASELLAPNEIAELLQRIADWRGWQTNPHPDLSYNREHRWVSATLRREEQGVSGPGLYGEGAASADELIDALEAYLLTA